MTPVGLDALLSQALSLRTTRQQILASNIANADTPGYKARDVDFSRVLTEVMTRAGVVDEDGFSLHRTSSAHYTMGGMSAASGDFDFDDQVMFRAEHQPSVDGNTVDMDIERSAFTDNVVQTEALLMFIRGMFKDMQLAITG